MFGLPLTQIGCATVFALLAMIAPSARAQQANVRVPFRAANDGFFEQNGTTGWSLSGPNWFARFGGGPAAPPFGGAQPGSGITGGASFVGGNGVSGGIGFMAGQGSRRSNVSQSGNLTLFDGYPGALSDTSQSPFVVGLIPVVGQGKAPWRQQWEGDIPTQTRQASPVAENSVAAPPRSSPTADPGLQSLDEIRRRRAATERTREQEAQQCLAKAQEARKAGKANVAKIYYRMALERAEGEWKGRIAAELRAIE